MVVRVVFVCAVVYYVVSYRYRLVHIVALLFREGPYCCIYVVQSLATRDKVAVAAI